MSRTLTVEHNGTSYRGELATIVRTALGYEDHGIFTAMLTCEWRSSGMGVGGYSLDTPARDLPPEFGRRVGTGFGLDHIARIMRVIGVDRWENVRGQLVIVLFEDPVAGGPAAGIASPTTDAVLIFAEHAAMWKDVER